jgi:hypothetical protein
MFERAKTVHTYSYQLILLREIIAVYFENHSKHLNTLFWQHLEFVNINEQVVRTVSIDLKRFKVSVSITAFTFGHIFFQANPVANIIIETQ